MAETIQKTVTKEPVFKPLKMIAGPSDCADASATDIIKEDYAENYSFKVAGKTVTKHAP